MGAPLALTFILPTRNRREWVGRAIDSCLRAAGAEVAVTVLVVDGSSSDGSFEHLQQRYAAEARVQLLRQAGAKGFMPACFFAIPLVQTPFVTFMYDDDVLSPYWGDLPRELRRRGAEFVMGFAAGAELASTAPFQRVSRLLVVTPTQLLRGYCGRGRELSPHGLPASPICCVTRTGRLREWMGELQRFTHEQPLREYFMIQRNAGPDLMIYFHSIASSAADVPVFDGPVAQFSTHRESMTSEFEPTDLTLGYWLAHVWLCDRLRGHPASTAAGWCAAYTVRQGLRLLLKRCRRRQGAWLASLAGEVFRLIGRTLGSAAAGSFLWSCLLLLLPRGWRPRFKPSPRIEQSLP